MNKGKAILKKVLSLLLAFALVIGYVPAAVFAADTDTTLYLVPNSNWTSDGARFAMYYWNNSGSHWASMTDEDGDGYYEAVLPAGYTNVIFCRMNGSATTNDWSYKWNQTADLSYDGINNCYTVADGTWDNGGGTWSVYAPEVPEETEPEETEPEETEPEETQPDTITVYFRNDWLWTDVSVYYWGSASDPSWPGTAMTLVGTDSGLDVYAAELPAGVTGMLFNGTKNDGSGSTDQTPDISAEDIADGQGYYIYWDNSNQYGLFAYTPEEPEETEPEETEPEETEPEETEPEETEPEETEPEETEPEVAEKCTVTLHFADTLNWGSVNLYSWTDAGTLLGGWPGTALSVDSDGFYTHTYEVEGGQTVNFIYNNGSAQTVDLSLGTVSTDVEKWVRISGESDGKYTCDILDEAFVIVQSPIVDGYEVTFNYQSDSAESVRVCGSWDSWAGTDMTMGDGGVWTATITVDSYGTYEYKFVVDGAWINDPCNNWTTGDDNNSAFVVLNPNAVDRNEITVNIHYVRSGGDYDGWNMWIWNDSGNLSREGTVIDGELVTTVVLVGRAVQNISIIPRMSTADSEWAAQETTFVVDLSNIVSGTVDYYITSGSSSGARVLSDDVVQGNKLTAVELDYDNGTIDVEVAQSVTGAQFEIAKAEGSGDAITVYFQNNWMWTDVSIYYWGTESDPSWPGMAMTWVENDGQYDIYSAQIPADVTGIIFNGTKNDGSGTDQTPDIKDAAIVAGQCYYMIWDNGNSYGTFDYGAAITVEVSGSGTGYTLTPSEALDLVTLHQYKVVFEGYEYDININQVYASDKFAAEYTYTGEDLGAAWGEDSTTFRVWAPTAAAVSVKLYQSGTEGTDDLIDTVEMDKDVNGTWVATVEGDLNGTYYTYAVTRDGETIEAVDPYARTTGVNGDRGMVIDLDSTDPEGWENDTNPNPSTDYTDAIIYELHVRDFSIDDSSGIIEDYQGKFLAFTQTGSTVNGEGGIATGIDYLKSLGVTHVHLLPVYDYASVDETTCSNFNWGYDPQNYNAPEGSYSTDPYRGEVRVEEFKEMVMALHEAGISVIMDVVYNHVYNADTFCMNQIVPGYFSRYQSNGSGCGNDTASEREMVQKYIVESVVYWTEEYHIDGFRFDLVGLLDTETINMLVDEVHEIRPDAIFYGEGWTLGTNVEAGYTMATQQNSAATPDFAYFSDTIRNLLAGSNGTSLGYASGATGKESSIISNFMANPGWTSSPTQIVQYASCHDNYTLIDKLILSTGAVGITDDIISMNNLTAAIYMTSQGISFIHAGEEMLREKLEEDGGRCENSYNATDYVNSIKWDNLETEEYADTVDYYQGLIAFRKAHAALRMTSTEDINAYIQSAVPASNVVAFLIDGYGTGDDDIFVIFNANSNSVAVSLPEGIWNVCIDGEDSGTETLYTAQTAVQVDGISAMVLTQADTGKNGAEVDEGTSSGTVTLYFSNNKYWGNVYAYYWGGSEVPSWPGNQMTYVQTNDYGESIYSVTLPAGTTNVIFNNGEGTQTVDLTAGADGTGYYCTDQNSEGKYECGTYTYSSSGGTTGGFTNDGIYEGDSQYYLFGWINSADYACNSCSEAMGKYQFVDGKLTVKFEQDSYVGVKTTGNGAWYMTNGWLGNVTSATLSNSDTLGSDADKLMIPGGVEVTLTLVENSDGTLTLSYVVNNSNAAADESGIQDGVTLHCWNWSFAEIEANMALIAEMGYTAIQTSPVQPIKEATVSSAVGTHWWVYYQPVDFVITTDEGNALGTKTELESMIETAHEYGIQVIVDVVANHLANESGNDLSDVIPSYLLADAYWHDITVNSDYSGRYSNTQQCLSGLPDLNTANEAVQQMVLDFLTECIDIGVDGFRFDAAKHIETPDDQLAYESDFWPTVVGGAEEYAQSNYSKDLYVYGEILDGTSGYAISDYTEYMSVTDNSWGNTLRENIGNSIAAVTAGYDKPADASSLVIWAESHDTYADGSSSDETAAEINKTWALVAARADAMGLYLARPESDEQLLGTASVTGWYSAEVQAVNEFHNAFVGQSEVVSNENGIAYVERGTSGAVLVNAAGGAAEVSVTAWALADGAYEDKITGNCFTVANGVITGQIGESGIAVLCEASTLRIVTQPESAIAAYNERVIVTVEAIGDGLSYQWYYSDDDGESFKLTTAYTGKTYKIEMTTARDGRKLYCVISDQYGNSVTTDTVTISKTPTAVEIIRQPESAAAAYNERVIVTVEAIGDGLSYQWYYSDNDGESFKLTTAYTGKTYKIEMTTARDGRKLYCVISDQYGNSVTTDTVTITMG